MREQKRQRQAVIWWKEGKEEGGERGIGKGQGAEA